MTCPIEFLTIIQGEDRDIPLRITSSDQSPYDLTGATEVRARFKKADGTILEKTMTGGAAISIVSAVAGKLNIRLATADTAVLLSGPRQDFALIVEKPAGKRKVNFRRAISVEKEAV